MKNTLEVFKTTNYAKFTFLEGNRGLKPVHFLRLKKSFQANHLISPIIVNSTFQIIDGQHRFSVCAELKLPIYYIILPDYGLKEVQVLNSNQHNWSNLEYLSSFCDQGLEHYLTLNSFYERFSEFSLGICVELLQGGQYKTKAYDKALLASNPKSMGVYHINPFREGGFVIGNLEKAEQTVTVLRNIGQYYAGYARRHFVHATVALLKNENFKIGVFMKKLRYQSTKLVDCTSSSAYKELMEHIYNYNNKHKVNLRLD